MRTWCSSLNSCAGVSGFTTNDRFRSCEYERFTRSLGYDCKRGSKLESLGDYVTVIYNPASKKRVHQLRDTRDIFLKYRKPDTPVAIVKGAYRDSQAITLTTLNNMLEHQDMLGMITTVIVGNSSTFHYDNMMINPRGYKSKYEIVKEV